MTSCWLPDAAWNRASVAGAGTAPFMHLRAVLAAARAGSREPEWPSRERNRMADKNLRDEITELAGAVRELRDREVADTLRELRAEVEKLRAERAAHHCYGCTCMHIHWQPYTWTVPGTITYPSYVVTSSTSTATAGLSGYNPAATTVSVSN